MRSVDRASHGQSAHHERSLLPFHPSLQPGEHILNEPFKIAELVEKADNRIVVDHERPPPRGTLAALAGLEGVRPARPDASVPARPPARTGRRRRADGRATRSGRRATGVRGRGRPSRRHWADRPANDVAAYRPTTPRHPGRCPSERRLARHDYREVARSAHLRDVVRAPRPPLLAQRS